MGVDGGGPDLGTGLMPGDLVTHINGEQLSLLAKSINNQIATWYNNTDNLYDHILYQIYVKSMPSVLCYDT